MSNGVAGKEKCGLGLLLTQVLWGRWWLECPVLNTCGFLINSYSQGIRRLCSPITIRWHYALLDSVNHLQPVQSPQDHRYGSPEWDFFNIGHLEEKKIPSHLLGQWIKTKTHTSKKQEQKNRDGPGCQSLIAWFSALSDGVCFPSRKMRLMEEVMIMFFLTWFA